MESIHQKIEITDDHWRKVMVIRQGICVSWLQPHSGFIENESYRHCRAQNMAKKSFSRNDDLRSCIHCPAHSFPHLTSSFRFRFHVHLKSHSACELRFTSIHMMSQFCTGIQLHKFSPMKPRFRQWNLDCLQRTLTWLRVSCDTRSQFQ